MKKIIGNQLTVGKILKIIRIYSSEDENAYDMAQKLGVSTSYLSAIENNKRMVPNNFLKKLKDNYGISGKLEDDYKKAVENSQRKVIINLQKLSKEQREVSLMCARKISTLSIKDLENIRKILLKEGAD